MSRGVMYLSGAITHNPNYKREFRAAQIALIEAGYTVISPLDICCDGWDWHKCMRRCIEVLASSCDCVAFIPSGYKSDGMALEVHIAERLGMPVRTVENWIKEGE